MHSVLDLSDKVIIDCIIELSQSIRYRGAIEYTVQKTIQYSTPLYCTHRITQNTTCSKT